MIKSLLMTLILMVGIISVDANDLSTTFASSNFEQVSTTVDQDEVIKLSVYPNPTTDIINVVSKAVISNIKIVNTIGQTVNTINSVNDYNSVIDMAEFNNGIYFIIIDDVDIIKVIKK